MEFLCRKSLEHALTLLKAENENMEVNIQELPEIIIIDTHFVTKHVYGSLHTLDEANTLDLTSDVWVKSEQIASTIIEPIPKGTPVTTPTPFPMVQLPTENNVIYNHTKQLAQLLPSTTTVMTPVQENPTPPPPTLTIKKLNTAEVGITAKVEQADVETATDNPYPTRERGVQTTDRSARTTDVAIQCNLNEQDLLDYGDDADVGTAKDSAEEKIKFLDYVTKNTQQYSSGKTECTLCGEVTVSTVMTQMHMALHWGPATLCHRCGTVVDHECMLSSHMCVLSKKKKALRLRKHLLETPFSCSWLRDIFPRKRVTAKQRGQLRRPPVLKHRNRKFFLRENLFSKLSNNLRCPICFKLCSNQLKFKGHKKRCLQHYIRRLKRKREKIEQILF